MLGNLAMIFAFPLLVSSGMSSSYSYIVKEESWLALSGSSTINSFECITNSEISKGNLIVSSNGNDNSISFSNAFLQINIKSFDCKNPLLNKDLYKALGVDKSPYITIELIEVISQRNDNQKQSGRIKASVSVTINGKCKVVDIPIDWQRVDNQKFRFTGSKDLNMTDFEIVPPSPAFGLIKVNNEINIGFSLVVEANNIDYLKTVSENIK